MFLLRVHAGSHARKACPVSIDLPLDPTGRVVLSQEPGQRPRHVQREPSAGGTRFTWMLGRLDAGAFQDFRLIPAPERREPSPRIRWREAEPGRWEALSEGVPVGSWDLTATYPGLASLRVSDDPAAPLLGGSQSTMQLEHAVHVRSILHQRMPPTSGPVFGRLAYVSHWLGARDEKLAEERTTWTVFATPAGLRLVDVELTLDATTGPVIFRSTPENSIWRLHLPASGLEVPNRERGPWLTPGPPAVAVCEHANNPGWPCAWQRDADGWLHACPFAGFASWAPLLESPRLELPLGESITWRFRLAASEGEHAVRAVRRHCHDFVDPPRVEIIESAP